MLITFACYFVNAVILEVSVFSNFLFYFAITDVILLADICEAFRKVCSKEYKLDAAHYVSSPQLSWDAMLSFTGMELELIGDPEIFKMLDNGMRFG